MKKSNIFVTSGKNKMSKEQGKLNVRLMLIAGKKNADSIRVKIEYLKTYIEYLKTYLSGMVDATVKERCNESIKRMQKEQITLEKQRYAYPRS